MATLRVTNLKGRTANVAPNFPDGANITGFATATNVNVSAGVTAGIGTFTTSVVVGSAVTANTDGVITSGIVTATSFVGDGSSLTGISQVGGASSVTFNDSVGAYWGTGEDLEVSHDGTHSYITNSTGDLRITDTSAMILATNSLRLKNGASNETYLAADNGGAVELYHDNTLQCSTSANGLSFPSGKGIDFSAAATGSADSNILDAYEEGTFTPVLTCATGTVGTVHSDTFGKYTKIGNRVLISLWTSVNKGSAGGVMEITGLPFTAASLGATQWLGSYYWYIPGGADDGANYKDWVYSICGVNEGGTTLKLYYGEVAKEQADAKIPNWDVVSGSYYMRVSHTFSYQVA